MRRRLSLTVALDWPTTAAQVHIFKQALEAEFTATKEKRFNGPLLGVGVTLFSSSVTGNQKIPRIWHRLVRHLVATRVISPATDPWCYHARVMELDKDEPPHIEITVTED